MSIVISNEDEKLDNTIKFISDGNYKSDNGTIQTEFLQSANMVIVTSNGRKVTWTPLAIKYIDENGFEDEIYIVQEVPLETKANYARFNRAFPDIDDWFIQLNNCLKHQILVQGFQRDPMPWLSGNIDFVVGGTLTFDEDIEVWADGINVIGDFETSGDINLKDSEGKVIFNLPQVVAYDSGIPDRAMITGKYQASFNKAGELNFSFVLDNDWISDLDRVYPLVIDPTVVVASTYTVNITAKPQILSNGWIVVAVRNSTTSVIFYVSKDGGTTFTLLTTWAVRSDGGFAICCKNTKVYAVSSAPAGTTVTKFVSFDATTVGSTISTLKTLSTVANYFGVAIGINQTGILTVAWSDTSDSYGMGGTGAVLRMVKSADDGTTWTKQSGVAGIDGIGSPPTDIFYYNPYLVYTGSDYPVIFYKYYDGVSEYRIYSIYWNGSAWSTPYLLYSSTSDIYNISAITKKNGANIGRIWCVWNLGSTNNYAKYSDDNGVTWNTTAISLGAGKRPCLSEKPNGDILVMYDDATNIKYQVCANGGITFSGLTTLGLGTTPVMSILTSQRIDYIYQTAANISSDKFLFNTAPLAPSGLTRSNFDATVNNNFTWTYSDPNLGDTQSAYQIQIIRVSDGVTVKDTGKIASTSPSYTLPSGSLVNGVQYQWKVTTWDSLDLQGPWSTLATFATGGAPIISVVYPAINGDTVPLSNLTAQWSFSDPNGYGQSAYQVKVTDNLDNVLFNSGVISDVNARSYTAGYTIANLNNYKVKIIVWNGLGIQSTEMVRTFYVSYTAPMAPILSYTNDNVRGSITLNINNPIPIGSQPLVTSNDVYRKLPTETNWTRIATGIASGGSFTDYTPASGQNYQYKVTSIGSNGVLIDSNIVTSSISIRNSQLSLVSYNDKYLALIYNPSKGQKITIQSLSMMFSGRTKPVTEFGEHNTNEVGVSFQIFEQTDLDMLQELIYSREALLFRDSRGKKMFCTVTNLDIKDELPNYWSVSFTPTEISYEEGV